MRKTLSRVFVAVVGSLALSNCNVDATVNIEANREKLELIANCLLEYETLEGFQVEEIVLTGKFTPPPPAPDVTPPSGAQAATPLGDVVPKPPKPEIGGLGSPAPATA